MSDDEPDILDVLRGKLVVDGLRRAGRDNNAATAPCGCMGRVVVGTYVACIEGCDESDGVPEHVEPEVTAPICPNALDIYSSVTCDGSALVKPWGDDCRDINGRTYWHCTGCGLDWHA